MPGGGLNETVTRPRWARRHGLIWRCRMIRRKARLLCTALSISVAVVAAGVVGLDSASGVVPPSISADPTTITAGASTTVTWDKIVSPTTKDWIGLYGS